LLLSGIQEREKMAMRTKRSSKREGNRAEVA
jgi:hypothetical protein